MPKFSLTPPNYEKAFKEYRKCVIRIGPDDEDTMTLKMPVFNSGNLEIALYWRKSFEEFCDIKNLGAPSKFTNALLLLSGPAKEKWVNARENILGNQNPTDARFRAVMDAFIGKCGARSTTAEDLRDFLLNIKKPRNMKFEEFKTRVIELDYYLPYLPGPFNQRLGEAALFSTLKKSVSAWRQKFEDGPVRSTVTNIEELSDYYEDLEEEEEMERNRRERKNRQLSNRNQNNQSGCRQCHHNNSSHH